MKTAPSRLLRYSALALLALPLLAQAHPGHAGHGYSDGFMHPFFGADHLLAMLAVGVWGALHARRIWLPPLVFVALLAVGAALGAHGLTVPWVEPLVAASVLGLGLMLAGIARPGNGLALGLIGAFALCHGMAHGSELGSGTATDLTVLFGIVSGSAVLHAIGIAGARRFLVAHPQLALSFGRSLAVLGGGLVLSTVF